MKSKNIKSLNRAVFVMRHFVELSAKLLPYYERITRSEPHSVDKLSEKNKIDVVYQTNHVNVNTSRFLLGSDIVVLIHKLYNVLQNRDEHSEKEVNDYLTAFKKEHRRLKKNWYQTLMN